MEEQKKRAEEARRLMDIELERQRELAERRRLEEEDARERLLEEEELARAEQERVEADARRREQELELINNQQKRKHDEALKAKQAVSERLAQIPQPFTMLSCNTMQRYARMLPFPYEPLSLSNAARVSEATDTELLQSSDPAMVAVIANALSQMDVSEITTRLDKYRQETNDLYLNLLPPLFGQVVDYMPSALDVDSHGDLQLGDDEDQIVEDLDRPGPSKLVTNLIEQAELAKRQQMASSLDYSQNMNDPLNNTMVMMPEGRDANQIRRQMVSLGKQPKAGNAQRKRREEMDGLFDSLSGFYAVSEDRRGRRKRNRETSDDDDEQLKKDLEKIREMEGEGYVLEQRPMESESDEELRFFDRKGGEKKKKKRETIDRPPTPTEVRSVRDAEWEQRQRQKLEQRKKRRVEGDDDGWNREAMAETDSINRFSSLLDQIFEDVETIDLSKLTRHKANTSKDDSTASYESDEDKEELNRQLLIERGVMNELRIEAAKLKSWSRLNEFPVDRMTKFVGILECNMRDVITSDGLDLAVPYDEEDDDAMSRELVEDRLIRAADAAVTALTIMTSRKISKQIILEDAIERAVSLCQQYLSKIIFPASDSSYKTSKKKVEETRRKKRTGTNKRTPMQDIIYYRITEVFAALGNLVRLHTIPDDSLHNMSTISISVFFVANVGELQVKALNLASEIFAKSDDQIRYPMLMDIVNSMHRLPPKNQTNSFRVGNDQWISNTTALVMQLIQSSIKMPHWKKPSDEEEAGKAQLNADAVVRDSFGQAVKMINRFLGAFIGKCSIKGNKLDGEEDYRRLFDAFLQDLLLALYRPEWPVADMILTSLSSILVMNFKSKALDITIRQACLDYLGSITARLRKELLIDDSSDERKELVLKTLIFEEEEEEGKYKDIEDVVLPKMSMSEQHRRLEVALIDFLVDQKGSNTDVSIRHAMLFYAGTWYKETAEDLELKRKMYKEELINSQLTDKEKRKSEKKFERIVDKGIQMKDFLCKLVDKKELKKRSAKNRCSHLLETDALWTVKYFAKNRELAHSFHQYLKHIVHGAGNETTVSLRTRALKCLTQIIEVDHDVLALDEVKNAVYNRLRDTNAQVREAAIELLGKFVLVKREYISTYYELLNDRSKDAGVAVRKRVIRIMRDICERYPDYENVPGMLTRMLRRVTDEEGVKKLVNETFQNLWFGPCNERQPQLLYHKVNVMTSVVQQCLADNSLQNLEQLVQTIIKSGDKNVVSSCTQIVNTLVDNILRLDTKMAQENTFNNENNLHAAEVQKANQDRLLACLTTLAIFSKVRPQLLVNHAETLQPYLMMSSVKTSTENSVMNEVIGMLGRVVPLMSHPSDEFLYGLDEQLANMALTSGMQLVVSAVSCAAAIWNRFKKGRPHITDKFLHFLNVLNNVKKKHDMSPDFKIDPKMYPSLQRFVFTVGVMARYFNFDEILGGPQDETASTSDDPAEESPERRKYRDNVFTLLEYFSRSQHPSMRQKALYGIGQFCAEHSEYMMKDTVKNMYVAILNSKTDELQALKIQVLDNLELFLTTEEKKMIKNQQDWEVTKDHENLKEMELSGSGLGSTVIQNYWKAVLACYFHVDENVRSASVQVTILTLMQGLVTPVCSIPTLIAMSTDPLHLIRNKVDGLVKEIESKYGGMVNNKALPGVQYAYKLHQKIEENKHRGQPFVVRGIRRSEFAMTAIGKDTSLPRHTNDGTAILGGLYRLLRTNREKRRALIQSMLKFFTEGFSDKLNLNEWIFIADNVAMFPYQMADEPLYVINLVDTIVASTGQHYLNKFKECLEPLSYYDHAPPQQEDDDIVFEPENLYRRFPKDMCQIYNLMVSSQSCYILLYLRTFLMSLYSITEVRLTEYLPSDAMKVNEKAISRKNIAMFKPLAALELLSVEWQQKRDSLEGKYELAQRISKFRKMLLMLDRDNNDDDEVIGGETNAADNGDDDLEEEEEDDGGGSGMDTVLDVPIE